jgi:hypothetical protein
VLRKKSYVIEIKTVIEHCLGQGQKKRRKKMPNEAGMSLKTNGENTAKVRLANMFLKIMDL